MPEKKRGDVPPEEVWAIRAELEKALKIEDAQGRVVGNAQYGVYAFYDFDGEPIYVGQTSERLRTRIRRHLTNQRTDAVAMNVLDPFEVLEIEMWPLWDLPAKTKKETNQVLNSAEYTVYASVIEKSGFHAVLNEGTIAVTGKVSLPRPVRVRIVPDDIYERRKHTDLRIARRASTIAKLAQVVSERSVSKGLRRTLWTQARRLERLAGQRYAEIYGGDDVLKDGKDNEV